ncbi:MAG: hypothetical protein HQ518_31470 [Rhodopirellula sp.]|nr:hypothetical protein [Rhodopirellula sp.]
MLKQVPQILRPILVGVFVVGMLSVTTFTERPHASDIRPPGEGTSLERQAVTVGPVRKVATATKSSSAKPANRTGNGSAEKRDLPISKEREEVAVDFAREHHPELAALLEGLRKTDTRNFQAGLRELTRDAERLGKMLERKDDRYRISLELWKLDSRIRLEVARMSMSPGEDFELRLRPLMEQRQAVRLQLTLLEHQRTAERLAKYEEQLKTLQSGSDELIDSEIERLRKLAVSKTRVKPRPQKPHDTTSTTAKAKRESSVTKASRPKNLPTSSSN